MEFSLSVIALVPFFSYHCIIATNAHTLDFDYTATSFAPTAQAASQQGKYLARVFAQLAKKSNIMSELSAAKVEGAETSRLDSLANALIRVSEIRPFHYTVSGIKFRRDSYFV